MNVYTTEKIRNVVLLGHSGCGKTSLVEAMAYLAGQATRMGTVADGSTISDFDKEEIKRQFSIHTSVVPIEWDNVKINILDTPGFFDFVGEVEEAVSAADAAIIVVSGKAGIQTGTKRVMGDMREIQAAEDDFRDRHGYRQCKLQGCGIKAAGALWQENSSIPSANQRE